MSNDHFKPLEITEQGLRMRQAAIAGGKSADGGNAPKYTLRFTRAGIGEGRPGPGDDPYYMTGVVAYAADMPVKESFADNVNHLITVVIDNAALVQGVMMTEIEIRAVLLDADDNVVIPECMYGYTYTDKYDYLPAGSGYVVQRELTFDTVLSRTANIKVAFDNSGAYATAADLAEHNNDPNAHGGLLGKSITYPLTDITHNLDNYPDAHIIEFSDGYGIGGYADGPYGGSNGRKLRYAVEYLDRDRIRILVEKQYYPVKEITQLNAKAYTVSFTGGTLILLVQLITNDIGGLAGVASFNGRTGKVTLEEPDIPGEIARKQDITSTVGNEVSNQLAQIPSFDGGEII